jgi:8-oxo-dGTP pyrophosphatase MutT (NUDIX family)
MVRKRYTHCFAAFVFGQYAKYDDEKLVYMFNNMTNQEKLDIISLRFDVMWFRVWLRFNVPLVKQAEITDWLDIYKTKTMLNFIHTALPKSMQDLFIRRKAKFENTFLTDNGDRLMGLMRRSKECADLQWEIPKGRMRSGETPIDCAVREFCEETGVKVDMYDLVQGISAFTDTSAHMGITYTSTYYVGITKFEFEPHVDINNSTQMVEVDAVRWVGINEMRYMPMGDQCRAHISKIIKVVKNRYKRT